MIDSGIAPHTPLTPPNSTPPTSNQIPKGKNSTNISSREFLQLVDETPRLLPRTRPYLHLPIPSLREHLRRAAGKEGLDNFE